MCVGNGLRAMRTATKLRRVRGVLRLLSGEVMSWTGSRRLGAGLVPSRRNLVPVDDDGQILELQVPAGTAGTVHVDVGAERAGNVRISSRSIAERRSWSRNETTRLRLRSNWV